jgi:hypothetical protein
MLLRQNACSVPPSDSRLLLLLHLETDQTGGLVKIYEEIGFRSRHILKVRALDTHTRLRARQETA